jgi:hypothetical protein
LALLEKALPKAVSKNNFGRPVDNENSLGKIRDSAGLIGFDRSG